MNDLYSRIYEIVRLIPAGRVTSYGAIAACIGSPQSSRMVGWAMNASHSLPCRIPAHRVVNRNGLLSGKFHFETPQTMAELLECEGIEVVNDQVADFENKFWDPCKELDFRLEQDN